MSRSAAARFLIAGGAIAALGVGSLLLLKTRPWSGAALSTLPAPAAARVPVQRSAAPAETTKPAPAPAARGPVKAENSRQPIGDVVAEALAAGRIEVGRQAPRNALEDQPGVRPTASERAQGVAAVDAALVGLTAGELGLAAAFERAGQETPVAADELVSRARAGATRSELVDFVRARFPDASTRLTAMAWIDRVRPLAAGAVPPAARQDATRSPEAARSGAKAPGVGLPPEPGAAGQGMGGGFVPLPR